MNEYFKMIYKITPQRRFYSSFLCKFYGVVFRCVSLTLGFSPVHWLCDWVAERGLFRNRHELYRYFAHIHQVYFLPHIHLRNAIVCCRLINYWQKTKTACRPPLPNKSWITTGKCYRLNSSIFFLHLRPPHTCSPHWILCDIIYYILLQWKCFPVNEKL